MISRNIEDYVKVYDSFISDDLCDKTVNSLQKVEWNVHKFYDPFKKQYFANEKELSTSFQTIPESMEIKERFWHAIEQYILKDFSHFSDWFDGWEGFSDLKFNRYDVDTRMKAHCDHIKTLFDGNRRGIPILTVLGCFNDNYKGGKFVMWNDTQINIRKGSVLIFPSNFMYPHLVTEVTEGVRYSCISWTW